MNELKTLKEMNGETDEYVVNREELRAEAIKWIKEIDGDCDNGGFDFDYEANADLTPVRSWIKHFFNINEEEIK
jgi:hypothetical protein